MISVVKNNVMYAGIILMTGRLLKCLEIERNLNHKKEKNGSFLLPAPVSMYSGDSIYCSKTVILYINIKYFSLYILSSFSLFF